jgi:hypothetical protein
MLNRAIGSPRCHPAKRQDSKIPPDSRVCPTNAVRSVERSVREHPTPIYDRVDIAKELRPRVVLDPRNITALMLRSGDVSSV